jgi:DNA-binding XRE family transcriptional regulator
MRDFGFVYLRYQRIEAGEKDLRLTTQHRLANIFKISLRDLFDFERNG